MHLAPRHSAGEREVGSNRPGASNCCSWSSVPRIPGSAYARAGSVFRTAHTVAHVWRPTVAASRECNVPRFSLRDEANDLLDRARLLEPAAQLNTQHGLKRDDRSVICRAIQQSAGREMRSVRGARFVGLIGAVLAAGSCRSDGESEPLGALARLSPTALSKSDAWALFDRSLATAFKPNNGVVTVEIGRSVPLAAVKLRGASPYRVDVRGRDGSPLGFPTIDLSTLSPGWHTVASNEIVSTDAVELRFVATGEAASVPELELWTLAPDASVPHASLSARTATDAVVPF